MCKIHVKLTSNVLPLPDNDCVNVTSLLTMISHYYIMLTGLGLDTVVGLREIYNIGKIYVA